MTPAPYVFKNLLGFRTYEPPAERWTCIMIGTTRIYTKVDE